MAEILSLNNSRIIFRNFSGVESKYNRAGDKNFAVLIEDEEVADQLIADGWNVKKRPPREEGDTPYMYLPVKVKFGTNPRLNPNIYLKTNGRMVKLDEESCSCIDNISILNVDMDIRPYDNVVNGKEYRSAYLQGMCVTQRLDRFAEEYAAQNAETDEGTPF